jgi:hypothetical protein
VGAHLGWTLVEWQDERPEISVLPSINLHPHHGCGDGVLDRTDLANAMGATSFLGYALARRNLAKVATPTEREALDELGKGLCHAPKLDALAAGRQAGLMLFSAKMPVGRIRRWQAAAFSSG